MLRLEQSPSFVHTADSFTSFRSQLKTYMFARHFVAGPLSAPPMPLPGLSRVINSLRCLLFWTDVVESGHFLVFEAVCAGRRWNDWHCQVHSQRHRHVHRRSKSLPLYLPQSPTVADNPCDVVANVPWFLYKQRSLIGELCSSNRIVMLSTAKLHDLYWQWHYSIVGIWFSH